MTATRIAPLTARDFAVPALCVAAPILFPFALFCPELFVGSLAIATVVALAIIRPWGAAFFGGLIIAAALVAGVVWFAVTFPVTVLCLLTIAACAAGGYLTTVYGPPAIGRWDRSAAPPSSMLTPFDGALDAVVAFVFPAFVYPAAVLVPVATPRLGDEHVVDLDSLPDALPITECVRRADVVSCVSPAAIESGSAVETVIAPAADAYVHLIPADLPPAPAAARKPAPKRKPAARSAVLAAACGPVTDAQAHTDRYVRVGKGSVLVRTATAADVRKGTQLYTRTPGGAFYPAV